MILRKWRPVIGYEGRYEVSTFGEVRNVKNGMVRTGHKTPRGYRAIGLYKNGVKTNRFVHSLVIEAFVGPQPIGTECCHGDGNGQNNRLTNLRWDTHKANMADMKRHGTNTRWQATVCPEGHEYTPDNTYTDKRGFRTCKRCQRVRSRAWKAAQS